MEKRWLMLFAVGILVLTTFSVSAEVIFNQQPKDVYNVGDSITVPVTVKALSDLSGNLILTLFCEGKQVKFFENGVDLSSGQEVKMSAVLSKDKLNFPADGCRVKAVLGEDYVLSDEFSVSNQIVVQSKIDKTDYNPGEAVVFKGDAFKSNGEGANGFVKFTIVTGNDTANLEVLETVNEGYFSVSLDLPSGLRAGAYLVKVDVYELNSKEEEINRGYMNYNINVAQVPASLEIILESEEGIVPGTQVNARAILHDQTGEVIATDSILTLKRSNNEILKQVEVGPDESLIYDVPYNHPPANWTIFAVSNLLDSEKIFSVIEKRDVEVSVANGTVLFTNKGNVLYNDSVLVKIGENSSLTVDIILAVDESIEYKINAPNGEYSVEVISDGQSRFSDTVLLTGKSIDLKEVKNFGVGVSPIIWVFVILVLGFVVLLTVKKGYRKTFFGKFKGFKKKRKSLRPSSESKPSKSGFLFNTKNRAKLSLSLKGEKQESAIVCFRIKNMDSLGKSGISETVGKITGYAEDKKAMIYENGDCVFFVFSPLKTKTFKNEKAAISLAQQIEVLLAYHNKIFKDKFDYGLSIDTGYAVSKMNSQGELEFVTMGNFIPNLKKIAAFSKGEILLSKAFKERSGSMVKTQDKNMDDVKVYMVREMRDREQYSKFIGNFLNNLEKDKKEREKRDKR